VVFGPALARPLQPRAKWACLARRPSLISALAALVLGSALVATAGCGDSNSSNGNSGGAAGTAGTAGTSGTTGETPANVAGDYTVDLTNVNNTCPTMADAWTDGAMNDGVDFLITQQGVKLSAETMGSPALYFLLLLGSNAFTGEIHGSHFVLTNHGSKEYTYETCDYTIDAIVEGELDGDSIAGTLTYTPIIKPSADCDGYECAAEQVFTGVRPPT
jgi:hypothetical protein